MWVTKLLIFPVEIRIYCFKTTKFGQKLAFLVNLGKAMQAYLVPCWLVGWCSWRAGCISQDSYLLYDITNTKDISSTAALRPGKAWCIAGKIGAGQFSHQDIWGVGKGGQR